VGEARGEGVGDADGEVLVPFSGVFVAEEVEVVGVEVPGHGHVEVDAALLGGMLVLMKLKKALEITLTISYGSAAMSSMWPGRTSSRLETGCSVSCP